MSGKFSDKLNEILGKISPTFNLISSLACIPLAGFIFNVTYMRANGFFSYEIFSINFMWIFLLMGIFFVLILLIIHGFYILGAYLRITHQRTETIQIIKDQIIIPTRNQKNWYCLLYNVCIIANITIAIMAFAFLAYCHKLYNNTILIDFNFLFISIFPIFEISIVIISYVAIDIKRWFAAFSVIFIGIFYILFLSAILYPELLGNIFKKALKSISLASDHVEIYLKDKNESINGELIFDDGKYAYVKFDRTVSNCGDVGDSCIKTIKKKVPSEDVSIITKVKKNTKASVPK
ncbi:hypothetical protein [uncultured Campylobacter sp.]|uniref:hypothetical protein n=1 Tax=uncultured Campylobacter sp. TaxID=218934 RepID=UPI00260893BA|nr:hypothetical protein [uncultured Campylobacter sp.]